MSALGEAVLIALASLTQQVVLAPHFPAVDRLVDLYLIVVVYISITKPQGHALLMGTAAGLLKDVLTHTLFGVNGFAKCLVAFLISGLSSKFMLNQPVPQFGSLVVGTLAEYGIAWALLATLGREFADPLLLQRALVNGALGMLLFGVFNRVARRGSRAAHAS